MIENCFVYEISIKKEWILSIDNRYKLTKIHQMINFNWIQKLKQL